MSRMINVQPVPCHHIYEWYEHKQQQGPSIGSNLLRRGYYQWSVGHIQFPDNNLYALPLALCFDGGLSQ